MVHDHHQGLPGYDPEQILHDGCPECESRGADPYLAICHLDGHNLIKAWERASTLMAHGLPNAATCELPMLRAIGAIQIVFERHGWWVTNADLLGFLKPA